MTPSTLATTKHRQFMLFTACAHTKENNELVNTKRQEQPDIGLLGHCDITSPRKEDKHFVTGRNRDSKQVNKQIIWNNMSDLRT